jgi:hypothetical protein
LLTFMDLPVTPLAVADVTGISAYLIHERVYRFSPTRCSVDFDAQHRSGRVFLAPEDRGHARSCKRSSENSSSTHSGEYGHEEGPRPLDPGPVAEMLAS